MTRAATGHVRSSTVPAHQIPTYRERLRLEGAALALCGALGSAVLLVAVDEATRLPGNTLGQLAFVAVLLLVLGRRSVARWLAAAEPLDDSADAGSGEPTPLWHLPLVVAALALPFGFGAGWDAGLRITGGCLLVGLWQALYLASLVAREETSRGVAFVRLSGSRLGRGTRLGALPAPPA